MYLINRLNAVNVNKAVDFILSCYNFDGGFGTRPGSESHAGQVNDDNLKFKKKYFYRFIVA